MWWCHFVPQKDGIQYSSKGSRKWRYLANRPLDGRKISLGWSDKNEGPGTVCGFTRPFVLNIHWQPCGARSTEGFDRSHT